VGHAPYDPPCELVDPRPPPLLDPPPLDPLRLPLDPVLPLEPVLPVDPVLPVVPVDAMLLTLERARSYASRPRSTIWLTLSVAWE
jgi:hypothetical protein